MKNSKKFPKRNSQAAIPHYCANCGMKFPKLEKSQLTQYRFCTDCGKPILGGGVQWTNIRVDDQGVVCGDESVPDDEVVKRPMSKYVQFFAHTPGGLLISGIALASLGYGLVLVATPLAAAGAALVATGAVVIKTAVIGGTLMGILVASLGEGNELRGVLYLGAVVAAAGVSMVIAGGLFVVLAGIAGALGAAMIAAGVITVGAVACHQIYLQNRKHGLTQKAKEALSEAGKAEGISDARESDIPQDLWAGLDKISIEESLMQALRNGTKSEPTQGLT